MFQIQPLLSAIFVLFIPLLLILTLQLTLPYFGFYDGLPPPSRTPHSIGVVKSELANLGLANSKSSSSQSTASMSKAPVIAVCHGGGPMPLLGDPTHKNMVASMRTKVPKVLGLDDNGKNEKNLKGIVLVTAHVRFSFILLCLGTAVFNLIQTRWQLIDNQWMEETPTISNASKHDLYFDYGGFPKEAYQLKYPAPGSPEIAGMVHELLSKAGFRPKTNSIRGTLRLEWQFPIK